MLTERVPDLSDALCSVGWTCSTTSLTGLRADVIETKAFANSDKLALEAMNTSLDVVRDRALLATDFKRGSRAEVFGR
jgi:hypothetical protein